MQRLYYFPSAKRKGYGNPYSENYKTAISTYYEVVDELSGDIGASICLLYHSFLADVFIFNWIESIYNSKLGIIQYWFTRLSFWIIKIRKRKMVWMLHNIRPHIGADKYSETLMSYMYEHANLIIAHSNEAAEYAKGRTNGMVEYICHPVAPIAISNGWDDAVEPCDVLIWGDVLPYKGVLEFVSNTQVRGSELNIFVVGKCKDTELREQLMTCCNGNIRYENRRASYSELKALMGKAKYVLFPYLSGSVSSSGALIDTIALGGTPVGPNLGAFKDLAEEGVCLVYDNYSSLLGLLSSSRNIDNNKREDFISQNTWDSFAKKLDYLLNENK